MSDNKPRRRRFTNEQIDNALLTLAVVGNSKRAAERLQESGFDISDGQLREWRTKTYADRYHQLLTEHGPKLDQAIVVGLREQIHSQAALETVLTEQLAQAAEAGQISAKDLPGALRNVSTAKAINSDKLLAFTGRPTSIIEHRSVDDIARKLQQLGVIEATAEDISRTPQPALPAASDT